MFDPILNTPLNFTKNLVLDFAKNNLLVGTIFKSFCRVTIKIEFFINLIIIEFNPLLRNVVKWSDTL